VLRLRLLHQSFQVAAHCGSPFVDDEGKAAGGGERTIAVSDGAAR